MIQDGFEGQTLLALHNCLHGMQLYAVEGAGDIDSPWKDTSLFCVLSEIVLDFSAAYHYRWLGAPKGVVGWMT